MIFRFFKNRKVYIFNNIYICLTMKIILDTCSVILLAKASVLEDFSEQHNLVITDGAYNEVVKGKEKKFLDALLLERLCKEKKISKTNVKSKYLVNKFKKDFGLGGGEASTIALTIETKQSILTDNKQGRKTAKVYGLKLLGSPEVVVSLFKIKKINKNKALDALKILRNFGWFDNYIIEKALEEIKNEWKKIFRSKNGARSLWYN